MAKSLDKVLQADGSYKWELVDSWDPSSEKSAKPAAKNLLLKSLPPKKQRLVR